MNSENDIVSDRALRYGRNNLFLSAVVIVAYVFQLDLSGASVLGIKPKEDGFFSVEQTIWLVLGIVLIWQLIYFRILVRENYLIWKAFVEEKNGGLPISLYQVPAIKLPQTIVIPRWPDEELRKQNHPTVHQWRADRIGSMNMNIPVEDHRQKYSSYKILILDRSIPIGSSVFAITLCVFSLFDLTLSWWFCRFGITFS